MSDVADQRRFTAAVEQLCGSDATTWPEIHAELRRFGFSETDARRVIAQNWVAIDPDPVSLSVAVRPAEPGYLLVPRGIARRACRVLDSLPTREPSMQPAGSIRLLRRLKARFGAMHPA